MANSLQDIKKSDIDQQKHIVDQRPFTQKNWISLIQTIFVLCGAGEPVAPAGFLRDCYLLVPPYVLALALSHPHSQSESFFGAVAGGTLDRGSEIENQEKIAGRKGQANEHDSCLTYHSLLWGSSPWPYAYEAHALPAELKRPCSCLQNNVPTHTEHGARLRIWVGLAKARVEKLTLALRPEALRSGCLRAGTRGM